MTRTLPAWIGFRRRGPGHWRVICKACGLVEERPTFWLASEFAHEHVAEHLAEQDELRAGA